MDIFKKLYFRLFKSRQVWHLRHYRSDFKIDWSNTKSAGGQPTFVNSEDHKVYINQHTLWRMKPLSKLRTQILHQAHIPTLAIIASGPSLQKQKWELLPSNAHLAFVNGAIRLKSQILSSSEQASCTAPESSVAPEQPITYFVVTDPNFIKTNVHILAEHLDAQTVCLFSVRAFYQLITENQNLAFDLAPNTYLIDQLHEPFAKPKSKPEELKNLSQQQKNIFYDSKTHVGFSMEPEIGIFNGGTVVYSMLQIAAYLTYSHIDIYGMDLGGNQRFYQEGQKAPSYLTRDYERLILPSMQWAQKILKTKNISVFNKSPNSRLPYSVFPFE